jgi:hypothetical protein
LSTTIDRYGSVRPHNETEEKTAKITSTRNLYNSLKNQLFIHLQTRPKRRRKHRPDPILLSNEPQPEDEIRRAKKETERFPRTSLVDVSQLDVRTDSTLNSEKTSAKCRPSGKAKIQNLADFHKGIRSTPVILVMEIFLMTLVTKETGGAI